MYYKHCFTKNRKNFTKKVLGKIFVGHISFANGFPNIASFDLNFGRRFKKLNQTKKPISFKLSQVYNVVKVFEISCVVQEKLRKREVTINLTRPVFTFICSCLVKQKKVFKYVKFLKKLTVNLEKFPILQFLYLYKLSSFFCNLLASECFVSYVTAQVLNVALRNSKRFGLRITLGFKINSQTSQFLNLKPVF